MEKRFITFFNNSDSPIPKGIFVRNEHGAILGVSSQDISPRQEGLVQTHGPVNIVEA